MILRFVITLGLISLLQSWQIVSVASVMAKVSGFAPT